MCIWEAGRGVVNHKILAAVFLSLYTVVGAALGPHITVILENLRGLLYFTIFQFVNKMYFVKGN